MSDTHSPVSTEDLTDLSQLFDRLKEYQNALVQKYPFAPSSRADANIAFGTARPTLDRLHPEGALGVSQIDAALRITKASDDPDAVLAGVESAIKDVGAIITKAKRRRAAGAIRAVVAPVESMAVTVTHQSETALDSRSRVHAPPGGEHIEAPAEGVQTPPESLQQAFLAQIWPASPRARRVLVSILVIVAAAFAVWASLTDKQKESIGALITSGG